MENKDSDIIIDLFKNHSSKTIGFNNTINKQEELTFFNDLKKLIESLNTDQRDVKHVYNHDNNEDEESDDVPLVLCSECFQYYDEYITMKIDFLINTWDLPIFNKFITSFSNMKNINFNNQAEFYEKTSGKIFKQSNKILQKLDYIINNNLLKISQEIINYIDKNGISILYLNDRLLLIYELWSLMFIDLQNFKVFLYCLIMKSRLIIIQYELIKIKNHIDIFTNNTHNTSGVASINFLLMIQKYSNLDSAIQGYEIFISTLIKNINEYLDPSSSSKIGNFNNSIDLSIFNECVDLYNDIEVMYFKFKYDADFDLNLDDADNTDTEDNRQELVSQKPISLENIIATNGNLLMNELPNLLKEFTTAKKNTQEETNIHILDQLKELGLQK